MLLIFSLVLDVRLQFKCLRRKFLMVRYSCQVRKWQTFQLSEVRLQRTLEKIQKILKCS